MNRKEMLTSSKTVKFKRFAPLSVPKEPESLPGYSLVQNYEFNKIKRGKHMFNQIELDFIKETADRDLKSVNAKVEEAVNQMATMGKRLADLKAMQCKLRSILQAIPEQEGDDDDE